MKGGFSSSLWLFVVNGYCVFEDDVCAGPSGVLDERLNNANISFSGFFVGPCTSWPEVIDKGPDYAAGLLLRFYAGARCPLEVQRSRCKAGIRRAFERSASASFFSSNFSTPFSSSFHLFLLFFLLPLPLFFGN